MVDSKKITEMTYSFCEEVRKKRDEMGISRDALARAAKLSHAAIVFIETKSHVPEFETVLKLGAVLQIDIAKYLKGVLA
jgi:hypothetical protein